MASFTTRDVVDAFRADVERATRVLGYAEVLVALTVDVLRRTEAVPRALQSVAFVHKLFDQARVLVSTPVKTKAYGPLRRGLPRGARKRLSTHTVPRGLDLRSVLVFPTERSTP